jgi:dephospho-CoA kinase
MLIGLTGGIATGKSTFATLIVEQLGAKFFDADAFVHRLLNENKEVIECILNAFGPRSMSTSGNIDKTYLRNLIYSDAQAKKKLERILHPRVREAWMSTAEQSKISGSFFLADIPLLYETGSSDFFDTVLVVAASKSVQGERMLRRGYSKETCDKIMASQLPLNQKVQCADHVIWNDGLLKNLHMEAATVSRLLMSHV